MKRPVDGFSFAPKIPGLLTLYWNMDEQARALREATGLGCLPGCGSCCNTPSRNIEVSDFEFLPLALHLWGTRQAEERLDALSTATPEIPCMLYDRTGLPTSGRCSVYRWRPMVCRLFGFAAERDKHGNPRLTLCRPLKLQTPALSGIALNMVAQGIEVPMMSRYMSALDSLEPRATSNRYPINEALRRALETVLYQAEILGLRPNADSKGSPGLEEAAH